VKTSVGSCFPQIPRKLPPKNPAEKFARGVFFFLAPPGEKKFFFFTVLLGILKNIKTRPRRNKGPKKKMAPKEREVVPDQTAKVENARPFCLNSGVSKKSFSSFPTGPEEVTDEKLCKTSPESQSKRWRAWDSTLWRWEWIPVKSQRVGKNQPASKRRRENARNRGYSSEQINAEVFNTRAPLVSECPCLAKQSVGLEWPGAVGFIWKWCTQEGPRPALPSARPRRKKSPRIFRKKFWVTWSSISTRRAVPYPNKTNAESPWWRGWPSDPDESRHRTRKNWPKQARQDICFCQKDWPALKCPPVSCHP